MQGYGESRYRALIEATPDALLAVDFEGGVMETNRAMVLLLGRSREELLGTEFSRLFESPKHAQEALETTLSEGSLRDFPARMLNHAGTPIPILFNGSVVLDADGNRIGAVASARDITELMEAREDLERSHRRLHTHLANSPGRRDRVGRRPAHYRLVEGRGEDLRLDRARGRGQHNRPGSEAHT